MLKQHLCLLLCLLQVQAFAQKDSFDLVKFKTPAKWKKELRDNLLVFSKVDKESGHWCQMSIVRSTTSKGSIDSDFDSDWQQLAADPYSVGKPAEELPVQEEDGWKTQTGVVWYWE